ASHHPPEDRPMANNRTIAAAVAGQGMVDPGADGPGDAKPMTSLQADRLRVLCDMADAPFDDTLTEAEAEARIQDLERRTGEDVDGDGDAGDDLIRP
ncbi:MAG: DUF3072 domain-containing protein, partial [Shimia sp.]